MNIEFLSTVAVIAPDPPASRKPYVETLGLPLEGHGGDDYHSEQIAGCKSLGIWPLSQAAEACFGTAQWPGGAAGAAGQHRVRRRGRRGGGPGGAGARAGRLRAAARTASGAVGSDGRKAAVAGGCDRRDLVRALCCTTTTD
jgi:catechol 2,3-dioxygenase-like lactoylglutathione lyase family enzyme